MRGHQLVITHGNGPHVGLLALRRAAYKPDEAYPLDVLSAETVGMIGYLIEQELENALGHDRPVAVLLTQIVVDTQDPAFANPTKSVGPVYAEAEARTIAAARGWAITADGDKWRRAVASPKPQEFPDLAVLRLLLRQGVVVICAGGGGSPVVRRGDGSLIGFEAVIDKDHASARLASSLMAEALLMLTDVAAVFRDFGTDHAAPIAKLTPGQAAALTLPQGSMVPKVAAACDFVQNGGRLAGIGRLEDAVAILNGTVGTLVTAHTI